MRGFGDGAAVSTGFFVEGVPVSLRATVVSGFTVAFGALAAGLGGASTFFDEVSVVFGAGSGFRSATTVSVFGVEVRGGSIAGFVVSTGLGADTVGAVGFATGSSLATGAATFDPRSALDKAI